MTAEQVLLLRHGLTDWNDAGRFQGRSDVGLNAVGLSQAAAVAQVLSGAGITRIVSSDLSRARRTADIVAEACGLPVENDPRLQEIDVGSWAGLTADQVGRADPGFWPAVRQGRDFRRSPTGETATEAGARVAAAVAEHTEATPDQGRLLVVSHGLTGRMAILQLLGLGQPQFRLFTGIGNCHWAVLLPGPQHWRLHVYNAGPQ